MIADLFGAAEKPAAEVLRVYCDLNRRKLSVQSLSGATKGRVIGKPDYLVLADVAFEVSAAGLARARAQKVRNVHAYARGRIVEMDIGEVMNAEDAIPIRYNPFERDTFFRGDTLAPVHRARLLALDGKTKVAFAVGVS